MKSLLCVLGTFVAIASAGADDFSGPRLGTPVPAPVPFPGTAEPMPVPRASYQVIPDQPDAGTHYSVPMPPTPAIESQYGGESTYSPALTEGTYGPMMIEGTPLPASPVACLYPHVRVRDPNRIAACSVPTIIQVPDPCNPCCCVYIEVCFPTCCCPEVSFGPRGRRIIFDFGAREVVVTSRAGGIVWVNYN